MEDQPQTRTIDDKIFEIALQLAQMRTTAEKDAFFLQLPSKVRAACIAEWHKPVIVREVLFESDSQGEYVKAVYTEITKDNGSGKLGGMSNGSTPRPAIVYHRNPAMLKMFREGKNNLVGVELEGWIEQHQTDSPYFIEAEGGPNRPLNTINTYGESYNDHELGFKAKWDAIVRQGGVITEAEAQQYRESARKPRTMQA